MKKKSLLSFCALLFLLTTYSQMLTVKGKVEDDKGNGIPGATISTGKSKKAITFTSTDGSFTVNVSANEVISISYIGFITQEVKATENVTVTLKADVNSLAEVVVTGIGVATSKRRLGISVESITSDKLPPVPAATLDQALVGKVPGAQISSVSGNPGDKVNIVLRGINTVQGGTRPLVMLDGLEIPFENLTTLDQHK